MREPDENSFRAADVAEPVRVFVLDHSTDDRRAAFGTSVVDQDDLDVAASDDVTLRLSEGR